jgi:hypothetical protein
MIDRANFWVPPGCLPGMSPEQTQDYLRELEKKHRQQFSSDLHDAFVADARNRIYSPRPGALATAFEAWENEHGVRLPKVLREVLDWQDGGHVRNTAIEIYSLGAIVPVDDDFWRFEEIPRAEAADQTKVFVFGHDNQVGGQFLLNYNARGATNEPNVYSFHNDGTGASLIAESLDQFLANQLAFSAEPGDDWDQARKGIEIIASETLDLEYVDGGRERLEQVLGRTDLALVLLTRLENSETVERTRIILPLPLDDFESSVEPVRTEPLATFGLYLQPEELDGIICCQSTQIEDGRWDNRTTHGTPIFGVFESISRDRLEDLRNRLFKASAAPQSRDKDEAKSDPTAFDRLNGLSPEDRRIATLLAAQKVKAEAKLAANPTSIDRAEAMFARYKIERMDEAIVRALSEGATLDIDLETRRRVEAAVWPE